MIKLKEVYISCYESDIFYRFHHIKFYFSSVTRRLRFINNHEAFIQAEKMKFRNKYHIKVEEDSIQEMLAIIYYTKCEKRGFKIEVFNENSGKEKEFYDLPTFNIQY